MGTNPVSNNEKIHTFTEDDAECYKFRNDTHDTKMEKQNNQRFL